MEIYESEMLPFFVKSLIALQIVLIIFKLTIMKQLPLWIVLSPIIFETILITIFILISILIIGKEEAKMRIIK